MIAQLVPYLFWNGTVWGGGVLKDQTQSQSLKHPDILPSLPLPPFLLQQIFPPPPPSPPSHSSSSVPSQTYRWTTSQHHFGVQKGHFTKILLSSLHPTTPTSKKKCRFHHLKLSQILSLHHPHHHVAFVSEGKKTHARGVFVSYRYRLILTCAIWSLPSAGITTLVHSSSSSFPIRNMEVKPTITTIIKWALIK